MIEYLINFIILVILNSIFALVIGWEPPQKSYIQFHD